MFDSVRTRASVLVAAGAVTVAFAVPGSAVETAGPDVRTATSVADSKRVVLSSPFGEARSRVKGTYGRAGTVRGWFTPRRFVTRDGKLKAIGRLNAVLIRADGSVRDRVTKRIVIPVRKIEGVRPSARNALQQPTSCQILNLVLGPLDLNLLGLHVHLNRVVLNIEAHPGPGNLLGNLLCAIAGLLDNTGVLRVIRRILNAILGVLRL
jgi:hypothetical protein